MKFQSFAFLGLFASTVALEVQVFSLHDLLQPTAETSHRIQDAIQEVGLIAVQTEDVEAHANALQELTKCIHSGAAGNHAQSVMLKDHTIRTTLATSTNESHAVPFTAGLQEQCAGFVRSSESLRAAAAMTGHAYASFLDQVAQVGPIANGVEGAFQSAVAHSESLEHFHLYHRKDERKPDAEPTLRMHTDLGMFIVMTPPQYFDLESLAAPSQEMATGFRLRLPDGSVVTPEFPPDSLLVMNGEGAANWVHSPVAQKLYVPPHEVVLPDLVGFGRAWYGRMYLPPRNAKKMDKKDVTFHQYWTEGSAAVVRAAGALVPLEDSHRNLLDQGNCSAGNLYCWMSCMSTVNVSTCNPQNIVCSDPNGNLWPDNFINATTGKAGHCFTCTLRCNSSSPSPSPMASSPAPASSPGSNPTPSTGSSPSASTPKVPAIAALVFLVLLASL